MKKWIVEYREVAIPKFLSDSLYIHFCNGQGNTLPTYEPS